MNFQPVQFCYTEALTAKDLEQLRNLFNHSAFWAAGRRFEDLAKAISYSCPVVTAWHGDNLVGFARATSDGVYRATIWDVVIHDDYQGAGFGRKLVETVLSHPHMSHVERVYLMTTNQKHFYERVGFSENETTTMVLLNQPIDGRLLRQVEEVIR
jgi:ribosomal protein S18 acetylase RimI-like enzyme